MADLYSRLNADVLQNKPNIVSILVGVNDVLKGMRMPHQMKTNKYIRLYQMMLDDIRSVLGNSMIIICEPFMLE